MKQVLLFAAAAATLAASSQAQNFVNVASATNGNIPTSESAYVGQSFTAGATANNITFNFYGASGAPVADGTGYLFSTAYTGTPKGLSSSDAGFLGSATVSFDKYDFSPSLTLQQGVQYFFYSNYDFAARSIYGGTTSANGSLSYTTAYKGDFESDPTEYLNYQVDGTTVTPEPSALLLLGSGLVGGVGMLRRKLIR